MPNAEIKSSVFVNDDSTNDWSGRDFEIIFFFFAFQQLHIYIAMLHSRSVSLPFSCTCLYVFSMNVIGFTIKPRLVQHHKRDSGATRFTWHRKVFISFAAVWILKSMRNLKSFFLVNFIQSDHSASQPGRQTTTKDELNKCISCFFINQKFLLAQHVFIYPKISRYWQICWTNFN